MLYSFANSRKTLLASYDRMPANQFLVLQLKYTCRQNVKIIHSP